ncbi:MAG: Metacaspase [uncultured Sulfurovum sp.]|uniref:Metacaspase n=1 Tax=uncultured Sulfurovum sp. TaxID=269237 RepID=A0A6S6S6I0_9BACT|nr:MAG: Metacaspase [uncultured Sulfurovum sp.]
MKKGISLHIGLNEVDVGYYKNRYFLSACKQDTLDMEEIASSQNFELSTVLLDEEATSEAIINAIKEASTQLIDGDILFISYSGHGAYVPDNNNDDSDKQDEVWCVYDRFLFDDELHYLWTLFEEGVRIFIVSDSCHSGTITKEMRFGKEPIVTKSLDDYVAKNIYLNDEQFYINKKKELPPVKDEDLKATVKLISGCKDSEKSLILGGDENSLLTKVLKEVWDAGYFVGTTQEFFEQIQEKVVEEAKKEDKKQTPQLYTIGKKNEAFETQKPFSVFE